jgi:hypothetical protein
VNGLAFRVAHLAAIAIVVAEAWLGIVCPLTSLEMWLREQGQARPTPAASSSTGCRACCTTTRPPWVFTAAYSLFGLAVAATWWRFPPRRRARDRRYEGSRAVGRGLSRRGAGLTTREDPPCPHRATGHARGGDALA